MVLGREIMVDVEDIEEYSVLETIDGIKPLMEKILKIVIWMLLANASINFHPMVLQFYIY